MAKILEMPKLSPTMEEGVLSAWHKKEGDEIGVDDLLAEVETDKATMEFRAFDKGVLLKLLVSPGAQVKLGQPVAIVGGAGEDVSGLLASTSAAGPSPQPSPRPSDPRPHDVTTSPSAGATAITPTQPPPETAAPVAQRRPPVAHILDRTSYASEPVENGGHATGRVVASPYVRKTARDLGIDLHGAQGSGRGGRVLPTDVEKLRGQQSTALARTPPTSPSGAMVAAYDRPEVRPLSPMRKTIARRLTESKATVPHFYLTIDVDASGLVKLREQINAELASQGAPANGTGPSDKVSFNDLLVKACAVALVHVPECNATFTPDAILIHKRVDISVAVAIPDGLVTPVVRNADRKSVVAIAREVRDLASRARARKLKPEEMADGTFSISNLGMFGIDQFAAVINPPEGAILAVGQVRDAAVVTNRAVTIGQRLGMTLSCDHRVVDGAVGAAFLAELRRLVERPLRVLTG
jgi:pyruvate dehydrogenase E2 component (dihydrolipoamide acetyltransferase)